MLRRADLRAGQAKLAWQAIHFAITAATKCCACGLTRNPPAAKSAGRIFMANIRVLATDLEFPEGPVVMPDGSVVLVEIRGQRLTRVWPDGRKEMVAKIPGGPNGAALGPDGKMYICNNGGFSWIPTAQHDHAGAAAGRLSRRLDPARRSADRQGRDRRRQMRRASAARAERSGVRQARRPLVLRPRQAPRSARWMSARSTTSSPA